MSKIFNMKPVDILSRAFIYRFNCDFIEIYVCPKGGVVIKFKKLIIPSPMRHWSFPEEKIIEFVVSDLKSYLFSNSINHFPLYLEQKIVNVLENHGERQKGWYINETKEC